MAGLTSPPTLQTDRLAVKPTSVLDCEHLSSLLRVDANTGITTVIPLRCKRWTCTFCCMLNEIQLREKVLTGKPTKMLTLTFRPDRRLTPSQTVRLVRPQVNRLYQRLRYHAGEWEAVTFLELHRSGYPHWHALVRGGYLPQSKISEAWANLTHSPIVDIRRIKDQQTALRYVSKYVTKTICYLLRAQLGRTVSFTRHYLPPRPKPEKDPAITWMRDLRHPGTLIDESYKRFEKRLVGNTVELLPPGHKFPAL
jgi:hypothetical protein